MEKVIRVQTGLSLASVRNKSMQYIGLFMHESSLLFWLKHQTVFPIPEPLALIKMKRSSCGENPGIRTRYLGLAKYRDCWHCHESIEEVNNFTRVSS